MNANDRRFAMQNPKCNLDFLNDDSGGGKLKGVLFKYIYGYIESNGPVTTDQLLQKWEETKQKVLDSDAYLDDHFDIIEFVLQSPLLVRINMYICVLRDVPKVTTLLQLAENIHLSNNNSELETPNRNIDGNSTKLIEHENDELMRSKSPAMPSEGRDQLQNDSNSKDNQQYYKHGNTEANNNTLKSSGTLNTVDIDDFYAMVVSGKHTLHRPNTASTVNPFRYDDPTESSQTFSVPSAATAKTKKHAQIKTQNGSKSRKFNHNDAELKCKKYMTSDTIPGIHEQFLFKLGAMKKAKAVSNSVESNSTQSNGCTDSFSADQISLMSKINSLNLLLDQKNSEIQTLKEDRERLRVELKFCHSTSSDIMQKYKILQKDQKMLTADMEKLMQERVSAAHDIKQDIQLLLEEKNARSDIQKELESCKQELKQSVAELDTFKHNYLRMKRTMLQKCLNLEFLGNKTFVMRNMDYCHCALDVINKVNFAVESTVGLRPIPDAPQYSHCIQEFGKVLDQQQEQYTKLMMSLVSDEEVERVNDIPLPLGNLPPRPNRPLSEAVMVAFNVHKLHLTQPFVRMPPPIMSMHTPIRPQLMMLPSSSTKYPVPQQPQHPQHPVFIVSPGPINSTVVQNVSSNNAPSQDSPKIVNVEDIMAVEDAEVQTAIVAKAEMESEKTDPSGEFRNYERIESERDTVEINILEKKDAILGEAEVFNLSEIFASPNDDNEDEATGADKNGLFIDDVNKEVERPDEEKEDNAGLSNLQPCKSLDTLMSGCHQIDNVGDVMEERFKHSITSLRPTYKSIDKLLYLLRKEYRGIADLDLLESIVEVRVKYNNSLTGVPLKSIAKQAGKYILARQDKYLCTYKPEINIATSTTGTMNTAKHNEGGSYQNGKKLNGKTISKFKSVPNSKSNTSTKGGNPKAKWNAQGNTKPNTKPNTKKNPKTCMNPSVQNTDKQPMMLINLKAAAQHLSKRQRGASTSSEGSVHKTETTAQAKLAWNSLPSRDPTWTKLNNETECIICMENLPSKSKNAYTLACQHTFHKMCIKNWFEHNRSCPTCRVHCTMDDEYPPLPS